MQTQPVNQFPLYCLLADGSENKALIKSCNRMMCPCTPGRIITWFHHHTLSNTHTKWRQGFLYNGNSIHALEKCEGVKTDSPPVDAAVVPKKRKTSNYKKLQENPEKYEEYKKRNREYQQEIRDKKRQAIEMEDAVKESTDSLEPVSVLQEPADSLEPVSVLKEPTVLEPALEPAVVEQVVVNGVVLYEILADEPVAPSKERDVWNEMEEDFLQIKQIINEMSSHIVEEKQNTTLKPVKSTATGTVKKTADEILVERKKKNRERAKLYYQKIKANPDCFAEYKQRRKNPHKKDVTTDSGLTDKELKEKNEHIANLSMKLFKLEQENRILKGENMIDFMNL